MLGRIAATAPGYISEAVHLMEPWLWRSLHLECFGLSLLTLSFSFSLACMWLVSLSIVPNK